jgi:hypothetical protein
MVETTSTNCRWTWQMAVSEKKGGRKLANLAQPGLVEAVEDIVADHTAGSPVDEGIRWTNQSPRQISEELQSKGTCLPHARTIHDKVYAPSLAICR